MTRWLRERLDPTLRVRANPRSYNTELGLPLAILDTAVDSSTLGGAVATVARATARGLLDARPLDVLILEMGLRHEGDARGLSAAVMPDVLVLTPLAPSFSNDLSFLDTVEREVSWLARQVSTRGGTVILCGDDPRLVAAVDPGLPRLRVYRRAQTRYDGNTLLLDVRGDRFAVGVDAVGDSALYALLAGVEVAKALGVDDGAIRRSLAGR
jgi:UDP-N-acetylmuramyl pentapeptide synthase